MASVVDKPSKALEQIEDSQYVESVCDESAYGSECGRNIELQNSVEETQEKIENNAQKLKYLEKSDDILRNLYTLLKAENATLINEKGLLMEKNDALENQNDVSQNLIVALKEEKDALQKK